MKAELRTAEQIVALFHRPSGVVWDLVEASRPRRAADVAIRDEHGTPVAYARPAGA